MWNDNFESAGTLIVHSCKWQGKIRAKRTEILAAISDYLAITLRIYYIINGESNSPRIIPSPSL